MKNKNISTIIAFILILILLMVLVYISEVNYENNNKNEIFGNIGLDSSELNILFFDVGQAESILITNNGESMLIDCGEPSDGKYVATFLKEQGINELDYLIGTHIDNDHVGGMKNVLKEITVDNLYMPYCTYFDKVFYKDLDKYLSSKSNFGNIKSGDMKIEMSLEQEYTLGDAVWRCLYVDNSNPQRDENFNNTSIVIELTYEDTKYLFMGDIENNIDSKIPGLSDIDVLKVAHHGAEETTSDDFLSIVKPEYAIISAGDYDNYDHPNEKTIQRLKDFQILDENIHITRYHGTIWLRSDGSNINIMQKNDLDLDGAYRH